MIAPLQGSKAQTNANQSYSNLNKLVDKQLSTSSRNETLFDYYFMCCSVCTVDRLY